MLDQRDVDSLVGRDVYGSDGAKIGGAKQVYLDDTSGQPAWVTVSTGLFGTKETFVPLSEAELAGDRLTVPFTKEFVKDAPNVDVDQHLSPEEEEQLYAYYNHSGYGETGHAESGTVGGVSGGNVEGRDDATGGYAGREADRTTGSDFDETGAGTVGHDTSGPTTDDAMTVSEERLNVGTERREAGRARLRKYVVTENVTQTVPVQREEVRLEREPITDANVGAATAGPDISEEEHEVVLHEERAVVEKETVPVERVRLDTETVTEQQTVGDEVRKERVEVDGDDTPGTNR